MQSGNSFDSSILLASLLIGVGYDAYVVSGYALKTITNYDQTKIVAEGLKDMVPESFHRQETTNTTTPNMPSLNTKYKVKKPKQLISNFLKKQQEKVQVMQAAAQKRAKDLEASNPVEEEEDELKGLRIHAWVLVLPGKREVSEAFFIESSTGVVYDCESDQYLGVESVWSSGNYWVNMQICYDGMKGISFDLADNVKWEFVLLDNTQPGVKKNEKENEGGSDDEQEEEKPSEIVDIPPSWVDRLVVTPEQFESKCPTGGKSINYKNAIKEVFAEYHRADGMVSRVTFLENDPIHKNVILEVYANRKDKIVHRVRLDDKIHEFFLPGRAHGLKEHIMIKGQTKELEFYGSARPDGLVKRKEEPRKVIYYFVDRDDRLSYRSVTYEINNVVIQLLTIEWRADTRSDHQND